MIHVEYSWAVCAVNHASDLYGNRIYTEVLQLGEAL